MGRLVELTWRDDSGAIVVEKAILVSDDVLLAINETSMFGLFDPKGNKKTVGDLFSDKVVFEDECGIFGLRPEQVIQIKFID